MSSRRDFCLTMIGAAAGLTLPRRALGQTATRAGLVVNRLADNLVEVTGAGANVAVLLSDDGPLMVDGGLPERAVELLDAVGGLAAGRPVRVLFNTHWHLDHTGSNERIGKAGGRIVAHLNTKRWLSSTVFVEAQNRRYPPRPLEAIPTETITAPATMKMGGEEIEYGPLPPGHTNGDIYVRFRTSNVLMAGDAVSVGRYPIMDYSTGGWIGGMIDATAALLKLSDDSTRVIPGAGPVQGRADLEAQHEMLTKVKERVQTMIRQGKGLPDVVAQTPTKEFDAKWGNPDLFLSMTYVGMIRHTHEIGGIL
jgi:glyoxylase-like metal-dependent hydrolase (beta-lactamase superfamily II)